MDQESSKDLPAIDTLWNFGDPDSSESAFRELLPRARQASAPEYEIEVLTQIARAQGLQQKFDDALQTLDEAESLLDRDMHTGKVRIVLERGRVKNSSGDPASSAPLFDEAFELAQRNHLEFYAVDAAHMLGIVSKGDDAIAWNERALALAEKSTDKRVRGWLGPLYNNLAWTYHDLGRYDDALELFQRDYAHRTSLDRLAEAAIARWSVANTLRHMGRVLEALEIQRELLEHPDRQNNDSEGYTREEIGECLLLLGRPDEAKPEFARAWQLLKDDPWLARDEPARLTRLKQLGGAE